MNAEPHWDYPGLLQRLHSNGHESMDDLRREAAGAIRALMETNRLLHRRAQVTESPLDREIGRLRSRQEHDKEWAISSFKRMRSAHQEIERIYQELRRAKPDGSDDNSGYHSVMDSRCDGGETPAGTVWANRFKTKRGGGIVSVHVAEIVGPLIDELIAFRKFFGSPAKTNEQP